MKENNMFVHYEVVFKNEKDDKYFGTFGLEENYEVAKNLFLGQSSFRPEVKLLKHTSCVEIEDSHINK
jgi:hypothetical protein